MNNPKFLWKYCRVDFESDPTGARIYHGINELGVTPFELALQEGEYELTATLPGLDPVTAKLNLQHQKNGRLPFFFEYATLDVKSDPPEAEIIVAEKSLGFTPKEIVVDLGPLGSRLRKMDIKA